MSRRGTSGIAVAAALTAVLLSACGGGEDGSSGSADKGADAGGRSAEELVKAVNKEMGATSFRAKGSSTAFDGGQQEMWVDPEQGLRIRVSAPELATTDMFCSEGTLYTSTALVSAQLAQKGQKVQVPKDLEDKYVTTTAGGSCNRLYEIFPGAKLDEKLNDEVGGRATTALVAESQGNKDVYQVAAKGKALVLRMDSEHGDRKSTTRYDSFGEELRITMPQKDSVIAMKEFQDAVK
ncbi:hypothetical protein MTQ01_23490 [Streptomyces sp. XM4193]|uniref:hypothetical protein n=1 Tax=Streptomyces sp. XM4193 TaxID=2929782 RepID=UPI001FF7B37D|nr:hypothetical protein [Streptomyces sp. XM4193]MCK1798936.1 hypothetical protein [Streptomyces sp. XM4193]